MILLLIKVGGFGIMALGSLLASMLTQRVSFKTKITSTEETLRELGVADFDAAVFTIGSSLEASILSNSLLIEAGVKQVWAKASSESHGWILEQIGVQHVIYPDKDIGKCAAHMVGGDQLDYVEIDEGFVMAKRPHVGLLPNQVG